MMKSSFIKRVLFVFLLGMCQLAGAQPSHAGSDVKFLPQTRPLTLEEDMSVRMMNGISRYLDRLLSASSQRQDRHATLPDRDRFRRIIGLADSLDSKIDMSYVSAVSVPSIVAENDYFVAHAVRWNVFGSIFGEGLLLQPKGAVKSRVVVIPDADENPEVLLGLIPGLADGQHYARTLAENGCQVIIPTIIDRSDRASGSQRLNRYTNQPHREWIYRQAYTFGRHIIGFEVQKVLAAVSWFDQQNQQEKLPIGVAGWGEGGLLGFYSTAVDTRIDAALVSGYFGKRDSLWQEPIYRNLFGLLPAFGDAEIANLIVPRKLLIEYADSPDIQGPPSPRPGSPRLGASAAPGCIKTQPYALVAAEADRARQLAGPEGSFISVCTDENKRGGHMYAHTLSLFLKHLQPSFKRLAAYHNRLVERRPPADLPARQVRQVAELEHFTQQLITSSRHDRDAWFWDNLKVSSTEEWITQTQKFKVSLWDSVMGRLPSENIPLNPRSHKIMDEPEWEGYEVTLDVAPDVFVWGYYLLPKDIKPGEKRPVIVVQHGGSGLPSNVLDSTSRAYKGIARTFVNSGYIVFAPHFPWRGGKNYFDLQRKANPLGLSVFSVILSQHERILDWLGMQPSVDASKIGLYGLSWGGKVAVRVPALLDRYSLSVCSGDFNEWIWKNATTDWGNSYMFNPEYEMFDFNLGHTFNYGEIAALIAPRAFMVERGHNDGVGIDEMAAFEYAKVYRLYNKLNIPEMTSIAYFNGGHEIDAKETLNFITRHFKRPIHINK